MHGWIDTGYAGGNVDRDGRFTNCYISVMNKRAVTRVRRCLALAISAAGACCLLVPAIAQETRVDDFDGAKPIEEIIVSVGRDGTRVDIDALLRDETRLKIIRAYLLEQHKREEELWRMRLRSSMQRKASRIAWGYDAQTEAARFRYSQANFLPIDRVQPATFVSIRF